MENAKQNNHPALIEDNVQATALLRRHGITPTAQRVQIALLLLARSQHMSADELLYQLNLGESKVSKATVYNTLGLFVEKGLVREVIVDPSKVFYDSNLNPHHHFFNTDSGCLIDIPPGELGLDKLPPAPPGMQATGVDIIIRVRNSSH